MFQFKAKRSVIDKYFDCECCKKRRPYIGDVSEDEKSTCIGYLYDSVVSNGEIYSFCKDKKCQEEYQVMKRMFKLWL